MALEVGNVVARLGARLDDDGFDRFERRLRNVRQDARDDVEVPLRGDFDRRGFDRFDRELDKAEKSRGRFAAGFAAVGPAAAAGFAAAGAAAGVLGAKFIDSASSIAESTSKIRTVLGEEGKALEDFAKTSATTIGQSREAALEATGTFAALFTNLGQSRAEAAKSSVDFVKLASDLASFNNTSPEEAIEALGAGLRGEAEPLRRYGVLLDDATLRAQALKDGLVKNTKEALDPQTRALAAQAVIFEQTKTQQGDFARTSDGLANQQRILKARLSDVGAELGERLLPFALKVVGGLNNLITAAQNGRGPLAAIGRAIRGAADAAGDAGRFIIGLGRSIAGAFDGGNRDATRLAGNFRRTFNTIVVNGRELGRSIARTFRGIQDDLSDIGRGALKALRAFEDFAQPIIRAIIPGLRRAIEGIAQVVRGVVRTIAAIFRGDFTDAFRGLAGIVRGALNVVRGVLGSALSGFATAAKKLGGAILDGIVDIVRGIPGRLRSLLISAKDRLTELPGQFKRTASSIGRAVVNGVVAGVGDLGQSIIDAGRNLGKKLIDAVKDFLGIKSPSRVFMGIGKDVVRGLAAGLDAGDVVKVAKKAFGSLPSLAAKLIKAGAIDVASIPIAGIEKLGDKLGGIFGGDGLGGKLKGAAKGAWQSMGTRAFAGALAQRFGLGLGSGYRDPATNAAVGGSPTSNHMKGTPANPGAWDIPVSAFGPMAGAGDALAAAARALGVPEVIWRAPDHYDHVHLGFYAAGARGPVGLESLGPLAAMLAAAGVADVNQLGKGTGRLRAFITDEGRLPEWVISQEGDRRANVAYAREALETLTGRRVHLHKYGKGIKGGRTAVRKGERGIESAQRRIDTLEGEYSRAERTFNRSDEELIGEDAQGNPILDKRAVEKRATELDELATKRLEIRRWLGILRDRIKRLRDALRVASSRLTRAARRIKGRKGKARRDRYRDEAAGYRDRRDELEPDLFRAGEDYKDSLEDLRDLRAEAEEVRATSAPPIELPDAPVLDVEDVVAEPPAPEPAAPADEPAPAAPDPAEVAAQALAAVEAFQSARGDLFGSYGSNYRTAGSSIGAVGLAAGARYYGADTAGAFTEAAGSSSTLTGGTTVVNNFAAPPPDPHTWARQQEFELNAL